MDNLPPPVSINSITPKEDDSLVEFKVKNPFQKFFTWIINFIKKNQNITIKIPIIGIFVALSSFGVGLGSGYNWGLNAAASTLFPNSSPVFHRAISVEGVIQTSSSKQYYLKSADNTLWKLNSTVDLAGYLNNRVTVKGNLTKEKLVIEVSEVIPLEIISPNIPNTPNTPNLPNVALPQLYTGLKWESSQKKILLFTSGKRRIEVEGFHLESYEQTAFPQEFINYYIADLKDKGFKETLNSIDSDGITVTYSNNEIFMTFGVKNIYTGKGDTKKISGYKAFIEHN